MLKGLHVCHLLDHCRGYSFICPAQAILGHLIPWKYYSFRCSNSAAHDDPVGWTRVQKYYSLKIRPALTLNFAPKDAPGLIFQGNLIFFHIQKSIFVQIQSCHLFLEHCYSSPNPTLWAECLEIPFLWKYWPQPLRSSSRALLKCAHLIHVACSQGIGNTAVSDFIPWIFHPSYNPLEAGLHRVSIKSSINWRLRRQLWPKHDGS